MKKHHLKTLSDILDVINENNIDHFLTDFRGWLELHINMKKAGGILKGLVEIKSEKTMQWIDDGKNDIKVNIDFKSSLSK